MQRSGSLIFFGERRRDLLAVVCWHIWEAHKDSQNNDVRLHPLRVANKVSAYVDMILLHSYKDNPAPKCDSSSHAPSWTPPPTGFVCMSVDAALFPTEGRVSWGDVIRD
jgi:hypothetical protein